MGFINNIKNGWRDGKAAFIIQNYLEYYSSNCIFSNANPATVATQLVSDVCNAQPNLFDGSFGQRAHKITVAAAALSLATKDVNDPNRMAYIYSLHSLMSEVEVNGRLYPLNSLDTQVLESSLETLTELVNTMEENMPEFSESDVDILTGQKNKTVANGDSKEVSELANLLVGILSIQITMMSDSGSLPSKAKDNWSIGYIAGVADAFLQIKNISNHSKSGHKLMTMIFIEIFGDSDGPDFFQKFMKLQTEGDSDIFDGMMIGGKEIFEWSKDKEKVPLGLSSHVRSGN